MPLCNTKGFVFSLLVSLPAAAAAGLPALAADSQPRQAVISVIGEGRSTMAPDTAVLTLSVVRQEKTAREALDGNNKAMSEVLAALKKAGIAERDLQTSGFSVQPQFNYPQSNDGQPKPPELIAYQVSNSL